MGFEFNPEDEDPHGECLHEIKRLKAINSALVKLCEEAIESHYAPDPNCSCHISPPCSDCVEYGGIRETVKYLREQFDAAMEAKP